MRERIITKLRHVEDGVDDILEIDDYIEEKRPFRLFFLKNDEDQSVEVAEVEEINFTEVEKRLKGEESVFISSKSRQHLGLRQVAGEDPEETWHFPNV